jgi:hypothetical protein
MILRRGLGEVEGLVDVISRLLNDRPALMKCALAAVHCDLGRVESAQEEIAALGGDHFPELPRDAYWPLAVTLLCDVCSSLGDASSAETLYAWLITSCGRNFNSPPAFLGSACRYLGVLAAAMSRWTEAETHFEHALDMNRRMGARPHLAHTQYEFAKMLVSRGGDDSVRAHNLCAQALDTARVLGMKPLTERAQALATAL